MFNVTDSIANNSGHNFYRQQAIKQLVSDSVCMLDGKAIPSNTFTSEGYFHLNPDFVDSTMIQEQAVSPSEVYGEQSKLLSYHTRNSTVGVGTPRAYPLGTSWYYLPFLLLPLIALLILRYTRGYLKQLPILLVSTKAAEKLQKSNMQNFNRMLSLLSAFAFVPACSLSLHILRSYPNSYQNEPSLRLLSYLLAFFVAWVLVKKVVLWFCGVLTYSQGLIRERNYNARIFFGSWGLFVFPLILLLTMNEDGGTDAVLTTVYISCCAFFILYMFRTLQLFLSERVSLFFWILYLCALEILPILLVLDYLFPIR